MNEHEELLRVFAAEAIDWVDAMETILLEYEEDPERGDCLPELMRLTHTLKGSAGIVGLSELSKLAHVTEGILVAVRQGALRLGPDVFDHLARAIDALAGAVKDIERLRGGHVAVEAAIDQLELWQASLGELGRPVRTCAERGPTLLALGEYDLVRLDLLERQGTPLRLASFPITDGSSELWAARVVAALREVGTVVATAPPASSYDRLQECDAFCVLLGSDCPTDVIVASLAAAQLPPPEVEPWTRPSAGGREDATSTRAILADRAMRVPLEALDDMLRLVGEVALCSDTIRRGQAAIHGDRASNELASAIGRRVDQLDSICAQLQASVLRTRMVPLERLARVVKRRARAAAREEGRRVSFEADLAGIELDARLTQDLTGPVADLACALALTRPAHGNASTTLQLRARQLGRRVRLVLASAAPPPPWALARLREQLAREGGQVETSGSEADPRVELSLPVTRAIVSVLLVQVGAEQFAFPLDTVAETLRLRASDVATVEGYRTIDVRGQALSLLLLEQLFAVPEPSRAEAFSVVVLRVNGTSVALAADHLLGIRSVVVKTTRSRIPHSQLVEGWAILSDERVVLLVDVEAMMTLAFDTSRVDRLGHPSEHQMEVA